MVEAVSLGRLDAYMQEIKSYNTKVCGLLAPHLRGGREMPLGAHGAPEATDGRRGGPGRAHRDEFDPKRPWETVWAAAVGDNTFWQMEVE
eukprot:4866563-Amphidinium_carterae.2